jgi:hypothetical protein
MVLLVKMVVCAYLPFYSCFWRCHVGHPLMIAYNAIYALGLSNRIEDLISNCNNILIARTERLHNFAPEFSGVYLRSSSLIFEI